MHSVGILEIFRMPEDKDLHGLRYEAVPSSVEANVEALEMSRTMHLWLITSVLVTLRVEAFSKPLSKVAFATHPCWSSAVQVVVTDIERAFVKNGCMFRDL